MGNLDPFCFPDDGSDNLYLQFGVSLTHFSFSVCFDSYTKPHLKYLYCCYPFTNQSLPIKQWWWATYCLHQQHYVVQVKVCPITECHIYIAMFICTTTQGGWSLFAQCVWPTQGCSISKVSMDVGNEGPNDQWKIDGLGVGVGGKTLVYSLTWRRHQSQHQKPFPKRAPHGPIRHGNHEFYMSSKVGRYFV